ncbi:MAG: hypothetical protein LBI60_04245 [Bacteroidales bacterium]|jgi:hypothetical protein|nr:hypothetical protein [Bacteroidales bacterium]
MEEQILENTTSPVVENVNIPQEELELNNEVQGYLKKASIWASISACLVFFCMGVNLYGSVLSVNYRLIFVLIIFLIAGLPAFFLFCFAVNARKALKSKDEKVTEKKMEVSMKYLFLVYLSICILLVIAVLSLPVFIFGDFIS